MKLIKSKKIHRNIILIFLSLISLVTLAQAPVDTIKLTPQELFDYNSKWNNLGMAQSYVDYSKDVLSSSDISFGYINKRVSTTANLSYTIATSNEKWGHTFLTSINPGWKYYGIGYGLSKTEENHISTLQTFVSSDFSFQKNVTISFIDVIKTKQLGKFGYSATISKTFWGDWPGPWEGQFTTDSLGNWVSNIYPMNPPSTQLITRAMLMYTYPIKTKIVDISPQVFVTSDFYTSFKSKDLEIGYWSDFNMDIYYGLSMNWKITNKFVLNTNIRLNNTIDTGPTSTSYKKSNPILFMIGTNFQL
jgi:hypothetical protein